MNIPDQLNLNALARQLTGQNDQAELSENGFECLQTLLEMVNYQKVKAIYKDKSTLESPFGHVEYNEGDKDDLIITRESLMGAFQDLEDALKNASAPSALNRGRILDNDCCGKIKTRYDKNPFWGIFISPLDENIFKHLPDYRSVNLKGILFELTFQQGQVIKILHEAYCNGTPYVSQAHILEELIDDDNGNNENENDNLKRTGKRLRDIFRSNPDAWKGLIARGKRKGAYRLNI